MNESSSGAFVILELISPAAMDFHSNLPAPTSERTTMNESNPGALGIPEFMPPDGGGTFIVNVPAPPGEHATMNESSQA